MSVRVPRGARKPERRTGRVGNTLRPLPPSLVVAVAGLRERLPRGLGRARWRVGVLVPAHGVRRYVEQPYDDRRRMLTAVVRETTDMLAQRHLGAQVVVCQTLAGATTVKVRAMLTARPGRDPLIAWEVVTLDDVVIEERTEKRR